MEGAALAEKKALDRAYWQAWHAVALQDWMKPHEFKSALKKYLGASDSRQSSQASRALAFFHAMKARGVPVEITRTTRH